MYSHLWGAGYGPDWVSETVAARSALQAWRTRALDNASSDTVIFKELTLNQAVFNGFGKHTACDLLYSIRLWPGMPTRTLCLSEEGFKEFEEALVRYAAIWVSKRYRTECLAIPNLTSSFSFNRNSNKHYLRHFLWVYRKCEVTEMRVDLYNHYARQGLLDPNHTIGG